MKTYITIVFFLCVPFLLQAQKEWKPTTQDISFRIKNAGFHINGTFDGWRTELFFSPDKLDVSHLKGTVEVKSAKTGIGLMEEHLKGPRFFDADSFKLIEVVSVKLYIKDAAYAGLFNVTIKGITRQVEIPFDFNQLGDEAEFKGTFHLKRSDFGIGGKSFTLSDDVEVSIDIKART